jgi:KAP family P-loop domain
MNLLDDNPTKDDRLGFAPTAEAIVEAIKNASSRPLTIGVFGGWGSGKTTLCRWPKPACTGTRSDHLVQCLEVLGERGRLECADPDHIADDEARSGPR